MTLGDHRRLIKRLYESGHYFGNQNMWIERSMGIWFDWLKVIA